MPERRLQVPKNIVELIKNPEAFERAMKLLSALERTEMITDGGKRVPIRISDENAIFDLRTTGYEVPIEATPEPQPPDPGLDSETIVWRDGALAAGGSLNDASITIADNLIRAIKAESFNSKIKYLLPLLGQNLAAARMPLRDTLGVGAATNSNFVDADFSQATGLKGNGTSKILDLKVKPSQLGTTNNGGLGYWENNLDLTGTAVEPIGCYNTAKSNRFVLDVRTAFRGFRWGSPGNACGDSNAPANGHFYGQRSADVLRQMYFNASLIGSNTSSDVTSGASDHSIRLLGTNDVSTVYWKGRCAVAYLTDGTLTSGEVSALHTLLQTYLITPTGR